MSLKNILEEDFSQIDEIKITYDSSFLLMSEGNTLMFRDPTNLEYSDDI